MAPQALALLNNQFVHEQSLALAQRVKNDAGDDPTRQVERAWWLALSRAPSESERQAALAHLEAQSRSADAPQGLASLCHVLLNLNEFIYVD